MKIALIMVKGECYSFKNRSVFFKHAPDCLTMGILYSIIKNAFPDIEIEIYDETVEEIHPENINADLIGISAISPAFYKAVSLAQVFRTKGKTVFIGGVHSTLFPEDCIKDFDSIMVGLANETLPQLIMDFQKDSMKKFYFQSKDMSFENFVHPKRDIYEEKHPMGTEINMVQATYGCPNVCEFCVQPYACRGYHKRPVDDVIEEIKQIKDDYIEFVDPNLSKDLNYLKELVEKLKPLKKEWFAPVTITIVKNEEILKLMNEAGCSGVLVGLESVNEDSISSIGKKFNNIEYYKEAISIFHKHNIEVTGSFVLGLAGDNKETEKKTLRFIEEAHLDFARYTINTPYPGTKYFSRLQKENKLLTLDFSKYDCHHCVIKHDKLTKEEIEQMQKNLWRKTYSLSCITKRLSYIKSRKARYLQIIKNYIMGKVYAKMIINHR